MVPLTGAGLRTSHTRPSPATDLTSRGGAGHRRISESGGTP
jgi:hypothetical protein